jgi:zinc-binding alcohol dehydrogenase/oxidoreductase
MIAAMLQGLDMPLTLAEMPVPVPGENEVLIRVKAAALNKRDYWITKGKYPGLVFPLVPGSDGVGLLEGKKVIINPGLAWGDLPQKFKPDFRILGMPDHGTLAEWVKVPSSQVYSMPDHLSWTEAAALPVCGVTAYRAMYYRAQVLPGERMLVTGIGGGVATMALLFGIASGMEVWVTSSSEDKIERAIHYGAKGGVLYSGAGWEKILETRAGGRFDVVIDGAGGEGFALLPQLMNPGGRIVVYGGTQGIVNGLSPQRIFWKQINILGTSMGSPADFQHMLAFVSQHRIKPIISHIFPLEQINEAMLIMARGEQFGKVCIEIPGD